MICTWIYIIISNNKQSTSSKLCFVDNELQFSSGFTVFGGLVYLVCTPQNYRCVGLGGARRMVGQTRVSPDGPM